MRERLLATVILVALLHALVILGVTFGGLAGGGGGAPGLEVLLVSDELPEAQANDSAIYLAQRTQLGSGNTQEAQAARTGRRQLATPGGGRPAEERTPIEESLLAAHAQSAQITYAAPPGAEQPRENAAATQPGDGAAQAAAAGDGGDVTLRGQQREELWVTPDTRASELAPYLDAWKRRVERIGTLNYPSAAQRLGLKGNPVLEVAIGADGRLQSATVRRSSGHAEIDAAALQILRLATPFEAFPEDLSKNYRVLRFAYEWQFVGGRLRTGTVSVP